MISLFIFSHQSMQLKIQTTSKHSPVNNQKYPKLGDQGKWKTIEFQEEEYLNVVIFHFSMSRASIPT